MKTDRETFAIETSGLTKKFRRADAVHELSLKAPKGSVYAFLGRNGAGKTTTIRMLLDLLDRTSGDAKVLGMDCRREALEIKRRVGYVAEGCRMYDWMRVDEIIWFCKGFYPSWDDSFASDLKHRLDLDGEKKIAELSRGTQARLLLLLSMAFHPELLILDEPTAGLDVVVRRNFLEGVIELLSEEGRTVFFSSHLVHEVERVADWVGIIHKGSLIFSGPIDELKNQVKLLYLTYDSLPASFSSIPGILKVDRNRRQAAVTVRDFSEATVKTARELGASGVTVNDLSLEDIFVALVGQEEG
ncbi:MAG: ABC transporter ATP-binding protein [Armatimonadetes bacterium]|nr:ABC transporter ATP-binding protein [Armatimonadota bacterium]